ncbi:Protein Y17G7B.13 [Aphelenchoides avenae]|nr:Protein Y17G7B.13 [Aphelenchus avenae]
MFDVVDPSDYRGFCLRGEGRNNIVISAKNATDGLRIVWRLAKHRKSATVSFKPKCQLVNAYLEKLIAPFITESYLVKAKIVNLPVGPLHHIAKVPSLPHNLKIDTWEELCDTSKYPHTMSVFPELSGRTAKTVRFISALEMPDATRIPKRIPAMYGPTITVEIKPKQGFSQTHPGVDVPFCNNCILQIEKWKSAAFEHMYDFCPLELYSGDRDRMASAIDSLIRDPHRNLRIFVDGNVVHDDESTLPREELEQVMFPGTQADTNTLTSALCCVLAGVDDDLREPFYLADDSVLAMLLKAQKLDTIGMVKAHEYYQSLPGNVQRQLKNKSNLLHGNMSFLEKSDNRSLLERYLLAATFKDCSLMVSVRLVEQGVGDNNMLSGQQVVRVRGRDASSPPLCFAYSVRIVDLDPKTSKNLLCAHERLMEGFRIIKANPGIHKQCRVGN